MTRPLGGEAWRARAYRPGDESPIVELFEQVFRRPITEDYWRWKLKTWPSPADNIGLAVGGDDRPIFHIGGIPNRFLIGSREVTVMVAVDAMTAPRFRRRGILTAVGRQVFDGWRESGIAMALGLPNERWDRAGFGWETLFPFRWRLRLLRPERVLARRLRLRWLDRWRFLGQAWDALWERSRSRTSDVAIREIGAAGPELDLVWERCRAGIGFSVIRDRAWVAWRYFGAPHIRYRVLLAERGGQPTGFAVYSVRATADRLWGMIPEVFASPNDRVTPRALIEEVVHRLRAEDVDGVAALSIPRTRLDWLFRRAGFWFSWGAFSVECVPFAPWLRLEDLRRPDAWYLAGGDFDVV